LVEERIITKAGETRWISHSWSPILNEDGSLRMIVSMVRDVTDRKRAEEELIRLSSAVKTSVDSIVIMDVGGKIIDVNEAAVKMYGADDKGDLIGQDILDFIAPEQRERGLAGIEFVLEKGYDMSLGYDAITKDGRRIPVELSAAVMKDAHDKSIGIVIIARDITERKRAEEALRGSEERLQGLVETMVEGMIFIAPDGQIVQANPAAERILGLKRSEIEARNYVAPEWEILRPDGTPMPPEEMAGPRAMKEKCLVKDVVMGAKRPDGSISWINVSAAPLINEAGGLEGVVGTFADITERKRMEEALRESEARFREVFDKVSESLFTIHVLDDGRFRIGMFNEAEEKATGVHCEEGEGKLLEEVFPAEIAQAVAANYRRCLEAGCPISYEEEANLLTGHKFFYTTLSPVRDEAGHIHRIIGSARDMTQIKLAEAERRRAEEALRRRNEELAALNRSARQLAESLDLAQIAENITRACVQTFGVRLAWLMRAEPDGSMGHIKHFPARVRYPAQVAIRWDDSPLGRGPTGRAVRGGKPVVFADLATIADYVPWREAALRQSFVTSAAIPLISSDKTVGCLNLYSDQRGFFTPERVEFFQTFANQAAIAIENARLYEQVQAAREQLRDLAGYLQNAREEERTQIARGIHDEFGQMLSALKMDLSWLSKRLPADQPHLAETASAMSDLIDSTIQIVRRVATELRPGLLDDLGLAAAMEWQAEEFTERTGIDCDLYLGDEEIVLDRDLATAIFRIFQETLTNVARHAEATEVHVELEDTPGELVLIVRDNGKGITESQASHPRSLGLIGMRERARSWGGEVAFQGVPGRGTTVTVRIPNVEFGMRNSE